LILLFGIGLIGGALERELRVRFKARATDLPYDWNDPDLRRQQRTTILASAGDAERIVVVWTGGRSGFGSTEAEMRQEAAVVGELIGLAERLQPGRTVDFHMLSSAGGLFEGQTHCSSASRSRPLRPYGAGKLAQEAALARASALDRRCIYRPSSVYGAGRSRRAGLITTLIANALSGRTTRISGNLNTLRDYVLADDIGRYMARTIMERAGPAEQVLLLASGRPASIFEVIERVRERVERPLLLQLDAHPSNVRDMSFLPSALPAGWRAASLVSGISQTVALIRSSRA